MRQPQAMASHTYSINDMFALAELQRWQTPWDHTLSIAVTHRTIDAKFSYNPPDALADVPNAISSEIT